MSHTRRRHKFGRLSPFITGSDSTSTRSDTMEPIKYYCGTFSTGHAPDVQRDCVSSCEGLPKGEYQSCTGSSFFVLCEADGTLTEARCPEEQEWDDAAKACVDAKGELIC